MQNQFYCSLIDFGSPAFDLALKLRYIVLREPLNLDFEVSDISTEYKNYHIAAFSSCSHQLVGYLMLAQAEKSVLKMRQVAVDSQFRSRGIGSTLLQWCEAFAKSAGNSKIILHARKTAVNFYKRNGYTLSGDPFIEVGLEHYYMEKQL